MPSMSDHLLVKRGERFAVALVCSLLRLILFLLFLLPSFALLRFLRFLPLLLHFLCLLHFLSFLRLLLFLPLLLHFLIRTFPRKRGARASFPLTLLLSLAQSGHRP